MTKQVYEDLKELETAYKKLSCSISKAFNTMEYEDQKLMAFCIWVAREVINEESWEVNSESFAEIACRKLNKLGIIDKQGDCWVFKEEEK
jgi:hypothetical protein